MLTTMDMESGKIMSRQFCEEYDQEVMRVEWNPAVPTMHAVAAELAGQLIERNAMPRDLREVDVDAFLRKMYAAQRS